MDDLQPKELNIIKTMSTEHYNFYNFDKITKDKFYKYFLDLYKTRSLDKIYYKFKPFDKFYKLIQNKCIKTEIYHNKLLLFNKGKQKKHKNIEYVRFKKKMRFYKVMDGFYDIVEEQRFIKENENIPFWFSSAFKAYIGMSQRNGGITAFISEKISKILIVNCHNIKILIDVIKKNENDRIDIVKRIITKKYAIELLELSSCANTLYDQIKIYQKLNSYDNTIWLAYESIVDNFSPCVTEQIKNDYFGITKSKGYHNYNFAYLLSYLNKKYFNGYFDAHIVKQKYTPYIYSGQSSEEIVFYNPYDIIKRNITDKFDWLNYQHNLDFKINKNFRLLNMYNIYNENFYLNRIYNENISTEKNIFYGLHFGKKLKIVFFDTNNYISFNEKCTQQKFKKNLINFIKLINADAYFLLNLESNSIKKNVENYKITQYENYCVLLKNKKTFNDVKISVNFLCDFLKPKKVDPLYDDFLKLVEKNYSCNAKIINNVISTKPDVIYFKSILTYNSPEFELLINEGYVTNKIKTDIFKHNKQHIFLKNNNNIRFDILDFNISCFFPIILIC